MSNLEYIITRPGIFKLTTVVRPLPILFIFLLKTYLIFAILYDAVQNANAELIDLFITIYYYLGVRDCVLYLGILFIRWFSLYGILWKSDSTGSQYFTRNWTRIVQSDRIRCFPWNIYRIPRLVCIHLWVVWKFNKQEVGKTSKYFHEYVELT